MPIRCKGVAHTRGQSAVFGVGVNSDATEICETPVVQHVGNGQGAYVVDVGEDIGVDDDGLGVVILTPH